MLKESKIYVYTFNINTRLRMYRIVYANDNISTQVICNRTKEAATITSTTTTTVTN